MKCPICGNDWDFVGIVAEAGITIKGKCPHIGEDLIKVIGQLQDELSVSEMSLTQCELRRKQEQDEHAATMSSMTAEILIRDKMLGSNRQEIERLKKELVIVCNLLVEIIKDVPKSIIEEPFNRLKALGIKVDFLSETNSEEK